MDIEQSGNVEVSPNTDIEAKPNSSEVINVNSSVEVEAQINRWTILGDDIYVPVDTNPSDTPQWMIDLITYVTDNHSSTSSSLADQIARFDNFETGYTTQVANFDTEFGSVWSTISTLVTYGEYSAGIQNIQTVLSNDYVSIANLNTLVAAWANDGSNGGAWFESSVTASVGVDIGANASNITNLVAQYNGVSASITTLDEIVVSGVDNLVSRTETLELDLGTAQGLIEETKSIIGTKTNIVYLDVADLGSITLDKLNADDLLYFTVGNATYPTNSVWRVLPKLSTPNIEMLGIATQSESQPPSPSDGDFWYQPSTERLFRYQYVTVGTYDWSPLGDRVYAEASVITYVNGKATGWRVFNDGTDSDMDIIADNFNLYKTDGTTKVLGVNTVTNTLTMNGDIVSANYSWGSPSIFGLFAEGETDSGNQYNIVGGKIYGTELNGVDFNYVTNAGYPTFGSYDIVGMHWELLDHLSTSYMGYSRTRYRIRFKSKVYPYNYGLITDDSIFRLKNSTASFGFYNFPDSPFLSGIYRTITVTESTESVEKHEYVIWIKHGASNLASTTVSVTRANVAGSTMYFSSFTLLGLTFTLYGFDVDISSSVTKLSSTLYIRESTVMTSSAISSGEFNIEVECYRKDSLDVNVTTWGDHSVETAVEAPWNGNLKVLGQSMRTSYTG